MTIAITHPFVSLKGDGGDATLVKPSHWNAAHTTSMASSKLIGRLTVGTGAFEEIPISALVAAALDETTGAAFLDALGVGGFETGDVKYGFSTSTSTGWLTLTGAGSIGKAGSGATILASATAQALYVLIYDNTLDANCPVSGGRTGVALNDFNSGKTLSLPNIAGRTIIGVGSADSGNPYNNAVASGSETVTLSAAQIPNHKHDVFLNDPGHFHTSNAFNGAGGAIFGGGSGFTYLGAVISDTKTTGITVRDTTGGGGTANQTGNQIAAQAGGGSHSNMQPYVALVAKVKL